MMINASVANHNYESDIDNSFTPVNLFGHTKEFKDLTSYKLMRGVPDFGSLVQFNPYETGYAVLICCGMPKFIETLAKYNADYNKLASNWQHIIEYEFKNFSGLEGMTADTIELGDDLNKINVISKVNMPGGSEFSMTFDEKSGSPLTKFARLYLSGIKDPKTQVKTYHGLIANGLLEPGFENEVFTFLYINTDNTMRYVEAAYLIVGCQLNSADTDMYEYTKGDISKKEVTVKFSGYPIQCPAVDAAAQDMLTYLLHKNAGARRIVVNMHDPKFAYTGIEKIGKTISYYNETVDDASHNKIDPDKLKKQFTSTDQSEKVSYQINNFYNAAKGTDVTE